MQDWYKTLNDIGAILHGNFTLTSGRQSTTYVEKFRILERPALMGELVSLAISKLPNKDFDYVAGMATGGWLVAYEFARQLGLSALYIEGKKDQMHIAYWQHLPPPSSRILLVDDVHTTGGTLKAAQNLLISLQLCPVHWAALIDRSSCDSDCISGYILGNKMEMGSSEPGTG